jgi:MFS family permease
MSDVEVEEEPTAAYWASLAGGVVGIIVSIILIGLADWVAGFSSDVLATYNGPSAAFFSAFGVWGLISSAVVIISAIELKSDPWEHTKWGAIILVFSIIGLGTILGLIGGILALVYKPEKSVSYHPPAEAAKRFCPHCGRTLIEGTRFCPYCGSQV